MCKEEKSCGTGLGEPFLVHHKAVRGGAHQRVGHQVGVGCAVGFQIPDFIRGLKALQSGINAGEVQLERLRFAVQSIVEQAFPHADPAAW